MSPDRFSGNKGFRVPHHLEESGWLEMAVLGKPDTPGWRKTIKEGGGQVVEHKGRIFPAEAVETFRSLKEHDPDKLGRLLTRSGVSLGDLPLLEDDG